MSASPTAMPVTTPALFTVAMALFEDAHVAWLVTDCVVPSASVAVAVNCVAAPTAGAVPPTATVATLGGDGLVGDFPLLQPLSNSVTPMHRTTRPRSTVDMGSPYSSST